MRRKRMAYRDDAGETLLRDRCASLENELTEIRARRETEKTLRAREEELRTELAKLRFDLSQRARKLPMLSQLSVASPCSADWESMIGDEKTRFCGSCSKNVHNLSAMTPDEAEALLQGSQKGGLGICVRYFQRADGTVMTEDCPVGVRKKRVRRVAALAIGAGVATATASALFPPRGVAMMGEPPPQSVPTVMGTAAPEQPAPQRAMMGGPRMSQESQTSQRRDLPRTID